MTEEASRYSASGATPVPTSSGESGGGGVTLNQWTPQRHHEIVRQIASLLVPPYNDAAVRHFMMNDIQDFLRDTLEYIGEQQGLYRKLEEECGELLELRGYGEEQLAEARRAVADLIAGRDRILVERSRALGKSLRATGMVSEALAQVIDLVTASVDEAEQG
jgi:hypothetical protein